MYALQVIVPELWIHSAIAQTTDVKVDRATCVQFLYISW